MFMRNTFLALISNNVTAFFRSKNPGRWKETVQLVFKRCLSVTKLVWTLKCNEGKFTFACVGDRSHTVQKKVNVRTNEREENHELINIDEG